MARSERQSAERPKGAGRDASSAVAAFENRVLEAKAQMLHDVGQLRKRHFVSPVMHDASMTVMLTLFIAECRSLDAGEQSVLLANHLPPREGAALLDTLVQAGLIATTGTMPGRRSVGLTPLGSARMRAYVAGYPEPM